MFARSPKVAYPAGGLFASIRGNMASPQKENGYTSISNEILEVLARISLSNYEARVLYVIFRKTYGWNKKSDWISLIQISELTGIKESHVSRTIRLLKEKNIVTKRGKNIEFNKDYHSWVNLPKGVNTHDGKNIPIGDKKLPIGVTEYTNRGIKNIPIGGDTKEKKETYTKETIQKKEDGYLKFKKLKDSFKIKNLDDLPPY